MPDTAMACNLDLRQTLEYYEATYLLHAKSHIYEQLRSINKELTLLNRLSRNAVTLAKHDMQSKLSGSGCEHDRE